MALLTRLPYLFGFGYGDDFLCEAGEGGVGSEHMTIYEESLEYHSKGRKGKIEVVPSKPVSTQQDLSLAYSPVWPNPANDRRKRGNGLRVHRQGKSRCGRLQRNRGPRVGGHRTAAAKPVMEGKGDSLQEICGYRCF